MKKTILKISIAFSAMAILLPGIAFGAISYSRSPSGFSITSPVTFNVSFDDWAELEECGDSEYWTIATEHQQGGGINYYGEHFSTSTLSAEFNLNLPLGDVFAVGISCDIEPDLHGIAIALEGDEESVIFTIVAESAALFSIPTSAQSELTANVSITLADQGLLLLILLAAGIPLTFYVIRQLIGLIPKSKTRKR